MTLMIKKGDTSDVPYIFIGVFFASSLVDIDKYAIFSLLLSDIVTWRLLKSE